MQEYSFTQTLIDMMQRGPNTTIHHMIHTHNHNLLKTITVHNLRTLHMQYVPPPFFSASETPFAFVPSFTES